MQLLVRVMQIVFEVASCPFQDDPSGDEWRGKLDDECFPSNLSLPTPIANLLSGQAICNTACDVFIRSMLLRVEYGGMKCDTQLLSSFAKKWLKRFQSAIVPDRLLENLASSSTLRPIYWGDVPHMIHAKAREQSARLVTSATIRPGGLPKLGLSDVSLAGIDFHCSSVVEYLLSQREICSAFHRCFAQTGDRNHHNDKIAEQLKQMIWDFSSSINHRRSLFKTETADVTSVIFKALWNNIVKACFDAYTMKFVKDRLVTST